MAETRDYHPKKIKLGKRDLPKFFKFIDQNYQDYYMRYIRILDREIPWEEIRKIEKGLNFGQVLGSLNDLNSNHCEKLLRRYKLEITWKDLARETLDNYFQNLLKTD